MLLALLGLDPALFEAPHVPALHHQAPLLLARIASPRGELAFLSTFTSFGAPLDVTVAALRVEHLFTADAATRAALADDAADVSKLDGAGPASDARRQ